MRILHTSDWHLGRRLGNQDRLPDQLARLEEISAIVQRENVDLLLVAGDIFDEQRGDGLAKIAEHLAALLRPLIERGLHVVFVAGNHDRAYVFVLLQALKQLVAGDAVERVYFIDRPQLLRLTVRDESVQLVLLPYPSPDRYDLAAGQWTSLDQRRRLLGDALRERMDELAREAQQGGKGIPTVLVGHFLLAGVQGGMCVNELEDVPIDSGDLPTYAYIALGHIHRAQAVRGPSIRYSGSIERMDQGEAADAKEVVLVDLAPRRKAVVRSVPLNATPFARFEVSSEEDLELRRREMAEPERTLVALRLMLRRDQSARGLQAIAARAFPRLYSTEIRFIEEEATAPTSFVARDDVATTVREYLSAALEADEDRPALLELADQLLAAQQAAEGARA